MLLFEGKIGTFIPFQIIKLQKFFLNQSYKIRNKRLKRQQLTPKKKNDLHKKKK